MAIDPDDPQAVLMMWKNVAAKLALLTVKANHPELDEDDAEKDAAVLLAACIDIERKREA